MCFVGVTMLLQSSHWSIPYEIPCSLTSYGGDELRGCDMKFPLFIGHALLFFFCVEDSVDETTRGMKKWVRDMQQVEATKKMNKWVLDMQQVIHPSIFLSSPKRVASIWYNLINCDHHQNISRGSWVCNSQVKSVPQKYLTKMWPKSMSKYSTFGAFRTSKSPFGQLFVTKRRFWGAPNGHFRASKVHLGNYLVHFVESAGRVVAPPRRRRYTPSALAMVILFLHWGGQEEAVPVHHVTTSSRICEGCKNGRLLLAGPKARRQFWRFWDQKCALFFKILLFIIIIVPAE